MAKMVSPESPQNKSSLLFSFFCAAFFLSFIFIICSNGAAAVLGQGNNSMEKVSPWLMSNKGRFPQTGLLSSSKIRLIYARQNSIFGGKIRPVLSTKHSTANQKKLRRIYESGLTNGASNTSLTA